MSSILVVSDCGRFLALATTKQVVVNLQKVWHKLQSESCLGAVPNISQSANGLSFQLVLHFPQIHYSLESSQRVFIDKFVTFIQTTDNYGNMLANTAITQWCLQTGEGLTDQSLGLSDWGFTKDFPINLQLPLAISQGVPSFPPHNRCLPDGHWLTSKPVWFGPYSFYSKLSSQFSRVETS